MAEVMQKVVVRSLLELDALVSVHVMGLPHEEVYYKINDGKGYKPTTKLKGYAKAIEDAWLVREVVKTWIFSKRTAFKENLLDVVSDRVIGKVRHFSLTYADLILHLEPVDFCLAALKTVGVEVTLELSDD